MESGKDSSLNLEALQSSETKKKYTGENSVFNNIISYWAECHHQKVYKQ